jgi:ABC-type phosphate transport system auxiliary subunit
MNTDDTLKLLDEQPESYDEYVDAYHARLAARVGAVLDQLDALRAELERIQIDLECGA